MYNNTKLIFRKVR